MDNTHAPVVVDGFLPNAAAVRAMALQATFIDWPGPDGETYKRICITDIPGVQERIEAVMGWPIDMLGMGFRLNYAGEMPNAAVHSDIGWGTHALVLFLCDGQGGTAFWQHKAAGASRIDPGDMALFERVKGDWNREEAWTMQRLAKLRFNRAVLFESTLFHSRWPFPAFGTCPADGRLIAVAFFSRAPT